MPPGTLSPRLAVKDPKLHAGGGGRPPVDRTRGGDWGGGRGGDGSPDYGERLRRYRLGMAIALVSIVMLFISISAAYLFRQATGVYDANSGTFVRDWQPVQLPMRVLWINTLLIVTSSLTIELARRQAIRQSVLAPVLDIPGIKAERSAPWLPITMALGLAFLGGQWLAWMELQRRGWFIFSGASSSFFYILTATHALHLAGGLMALMYALLISALKKPLEQRRIVIDVTAWYWHVIDVLWIYLFALLALRR